MLALEYIGENHVAHAAWMQVQIAATGAPMAYFRTGLPKPWVARITGRDPVYGYARQFMRGQKDYSQANSIGSRGVYLYYALESGVYEVNRRVSWKRSRRYFIRVEDAQIAEIDEQEVGRWLDSQADMPNAG